jgi:hypothetical protein
MNRTILFDYLDDNSIDTGVLLGFYSFDNYSGNYTFNDKYSDATGSSISNGNVKADTLPLVSLCSEDAVNTVSGSGYLDGNTALQLGDKFDSSNWTIFLNYETDDFSGNKNLGRTLFTSYTSGADSSGFSVGLNGAQKLYFEYKDTGNAKHIKTLNAELGRKNIISISKSSNAKSIEIIFHDFLYDSSVTGYFGISDAFSGTTDLTITNNLYFGDYYETSVADYTGFSGYIDDLVVFNTSLATNFKDDIAKLMISSGYSKQRLVEQTFLYTGVTGNPIITTGVTGSGITGYESVLSGTVSGRCSGDNFDVYVNSGVTGDLTGTTISYADATGILTGSRQILTGSEILVDDSESRKYSRKNLTTFSPIKDSGSLEIYNFYTINPRTNKSATAVLAETGYLNLGTGFESGTNFNLFLNGAYQRSGTASGDSILSGDFYVSGENLAYLESGVSYEGLYFDSVYDENTGSFNHSGFDYTGGVIGPRFWLDFDIYLNGIKLISGTGQDWYSGVGETVNFNTGSLFGATGELIAAPRQNIDNVIVQVDNSLATDSSGFLSEQTWLNGQRILRNKNYLLVSDNSSLNSNKKIRFIDDFSVYKGEEEGF